MEDTDVAVLRELRDRHYKEQEVERRVRESQDRDRPSFRILTRSSTIPCLYGAQALNIIAPQDIEAIVGTEGDAGHNCLFYMDGFWSLGFHGFRDLFVPMYSDLDLGGG